LRIGEVELRLDVEEDQRFLARDFRQGRGRQAGEVATHRIRRLADKPDFYP
jgi:hypothetical protein